MKAKSAEIRKFIIENVDRHPRDICQAVASKFEISRQAVNRHMKTLIEDGAIEAQGKTSDRAYTLKKTEKIFRFDVAQNHEEHVVWERYIHDLVVHLEVNVYRILLFGFTEIYNNVVDHSGATFVDVCIETSPRSIEITISDDGIGIFEKIKSQFGLNDHREAVLELSKGKLTTDPSNHSGQGIFFTSRMYDQFNIMSDHLYFSHQKNKDDDWLIETSAKDSPGTAVFMEIEADSPRTTKEVFDSYTDLESGDYAFSKTHVPVSLAKYDGGQLVSRSQAKRVLSRFDRFKEVFLDFQGVDSIGQSFADEIFRVFSRNNPDIKIIAVRANKAVQEMISRAKSSASTPSSPSKFEGEPTGQ